MKTIEALAKMYRTKGYFSDSTGLVGVRHKGLIQWFRLDANGNLQNTGSTRTPQGADYKRVSGRGQSQ